MFIDHVIYFQTILVKLLIVEAFHIQGSFLRFTHVTLLTSHALSNPNSTRSLSISRDLTFAWDIHAISLGSKILNCSTALFSFQRSHRRFLSHNELSCRLIRRLLPHLNFLNAYTSSHSILPSPSLLAILIPSLTSMR